MLENLDIWKTFATSAITFLLSLLVYSLCRDNGETRPEVSEVFVNVVSVLALLGFVASVFCIYLGIWSAP